MRKLDKKVLLEEQKILDEINRSGKYSFKQTIDEYGHIHVDCDAETFIREMGLITLDEHFKRLGEILDECARQHKINYDKNQIFGH